MAELRRRGEKGVQNGGEAGEKERENRTVREKGDERGTADGKGQEGRGARMRRTGREDCTGRRVWGTGREPGRGHGGRARIRRRGWGREVRGGGRRARGRGAARWGRGGGSAGGGRRGGGSGYRAGGGGEAGAGRGLGRRGEPRILRGAAVEEAAPGRRRTDRSTAERAQTDGRRPEGIAGPRQRRRTMRGPRPRAGGRCPGG